MENIIYVCFQNPTGECAYFMNMDNQSQYKKQGVEEAAVKWLIKQAMQRKKYIWKHPKRGKGCTKKWDLSPWKV